jgi:hypothetical protein
LISICVTSPLTFIQRKYPRVITAHALHGWSPDRDSVNHLLSLSVSSLRSLRFRVYRQITRGGVEVDVSTLRDVCHRIATTNTSFRDISLLKYLGSIEYAWPICAAACDEFLQPYNNQQQQQHSSNRMKKNGNRPSVRYNGRLSRRCNKCHKWSWTISCNICDRKKCIICDRDGISQGKGNKRGNIAPHYLSLDPVFRVLFMYMCCWMVYCRWLYLLWFLCK